MNIASEKLLQEQSNLNNIQLEINRRLRYFKQAEHISQRLQSPTLSVASDNFKELLNEIDTCLNYLMENVSAIFVFLLNSILLLLISEVLFFYHSLQLNLIV